MEEIMQVLTITWNPEKDITTVKFNDNFIESDSAVHWDVLQDAIRILQDTYDVSLTRLDNKYAGVPKKVNSDLETEYA
jgi:hypothetical protein